jgi:hypothetical protein
MLQGLSGTGLVWHQRNWPACPFKQAQETLQANGNIVAVLLERKRKRTSVANRVVILRQTHVESVQLMLDHRWNAIRERTLRVFGEAGAREER